MAKLKKMLRSFDGEAGEGASFFWTAGCTRDVHLCVACLHALFIVRICRKLYVRSMVTVRLTMLI